MVQHFMPEIGAHQCQNIILIIFSYKFCICLLIWARTKHLISTTKHPFPISCDVTTKKHQLLALSLYTSAMTIGDNMTALYRTLECVPAAFKHNTVRWRLSCTQIRHNRKTKTQISDKNASVRKKNNNR